jgi:hypothetical protein
VVKKRMLYAPPEGAASLAADLAATHTLSRRTLSMKNAAPVSFPTNHFTTTRKQNQQAEENCLEPSIHVWGTYRRDLGNLYGFVVGG